jgi:hypothetical protein
VEIEEPKHQRGSFQEKRRLLSRLMSSGKKRKKKVESFVDSWKQEGF